MNRKYKLISLALLATGIFLPQIAVSQAPQKISYQAVIPENSDRLVTSHAVGIKITILQGSPTGTVVYTETQTSYTNANGLISIEIGGKAGFSSIDWSTGTYFLKTEVDPAGGTSYSITGTSQLLSVPFAMHAKTVEAVTETDPVFISWDKTYADLINKPTAISEFTMNANSQNITGLADPVNATDAATKAYVDILLQKITYLESLHGIEDPVTDVDGNSYKTIRIGTQVWISENLKTTKYNDGIAITLKEGSAEWAQPASPGYCWYANDQLNYGNTYGALYNWYAISTTTNGNRNICPTGWHVPSGNEWVTLTSYLGTSSGGKLKETGTKHWFIPNTGATNETGFTALPGGYLHYSGEWVEGMGQYGYWWSSSENGSNAYRLFMSYNSDVASGANLNKNCGFSVRCIKD